jgi:NAD(P)H-hydrate epimerase
MVERVVDIPALPPRTDDGHKGTYGTVLVIAGSDGMLGAAILAARGALRGGAGLVRACLPGELRSAFMTAVPSATTLVREGACGAWLQGVSAVVAGPGLTPEPATAALIHELLGAAAVPLVLDADALNALAPLQRPLATRAPALLTPHPGEAGRLLGCATRDVSADRHAAALELARQSRQIAVLKGARTVVTDGRRLFENRTGNPGLATGGTGDVLSGLLGALLAQGMAPFEAACLGVHVHGAAGELVARRLSQVGLIAEDLPLAIAEVLGS